MRTKLYDAPGPVRGELVKFELSLLHHASVCFDHLFQEVLPDCPLGFSRVLGIWMVSSPVPQAQNGVVPWKAASVVASATQGPYMENVLGSCLWYTSTTVFKS